MTERNMETSDQCLVWIKVNDLNWGPKPYKVNICWLDYVDFNKLVKDEWVSFLVLGNYGFVMNNKLKMIREILRW